MSSRGKKDCPNCKEEIGARCNICPLCGYQFSTGEIRKDLIKDKKDLTPKTYTSLGRGRKKCPGCEKIIGGVTKICPKCNFDFVSAKKEKVEAKKEKKKEEPVKEKYVDPRIKELCGISFYEEPEQLSPKEHAERILSYGAKRAKILLGIALNNKYWSHVDWEVVKQGLV